MHYLVQINKKLIFCLSIILFGFIKLIKTLICDVLKILIVTYPNFYNYQQFLKLYVNSSIGLFIKYLA